MNTEKLDIEISDLLRDEVSLWIEDGFADAQAINSGGCVDFASTFVTRHEKKFSLDFGDSYDFYDKEINRDIYANMDKNSPLLLNLIDLPNKYRLPDHKASHVFIYCALNNKFYDAECVEGVLDPLDLPIFQRFYDESIFMFESSGRAEALGLNEKEKKKKSCTTKYKPR